MKFSKELLGTILHITIQDEVIDKNDFIFCVGIVENFENKYSRFKTGNKLGEINQNKKATIDSELYSIITLAQKISKISEGYYDISVLPFLENSGYGISEKKLDESFGYKNIELTKTKLSDGVQRYNLELKNNISIELGSIGKGYLIDKTYNYLSKKYSKFIIDFGGDIRTKGMYKIDLENPDSQGDSLGSVNIYNVSIAGSSGNKRTFNNTHHLVTKHQDSSNKEKKALFVTHRLATMSDAFATALYVSPIDICKKIISRTPGLEAYILLESGEILKSNGFKINNVKN